MSKSNTQERDGVPGSRRAVALQYTGKNAAPVVVASGMGYMAEKIVEVASDHGVPVYEDTSLTTILSQLQLGQEIPESLYQAIVEIYVYLLEFDPNDPEKSQRKREALRQSARDQAQRQGVSPTGADTAQEHWIEEGEMGSHGI